MKQTISILSLCAVALLAGCKAENDLPQQEEGGRVVTFMATPASTTKVDNTANGPQFSKGDEISVFAPLTGRWRIDADYGQNSGKPDGLAKDCRYVADNNNNFSAKQDEDKIRYGSTSTALDFYAVWPAQRESDPSAVVDKNSYTIDLKDITDQRKVGDVPPYMYSNNARNHGMQSTSGGVVNLEFRYVLSKITVSVDYDPSTMGGALASVEFWADGGLYSECEIDLKLENYDKVATNGGRNVLANESHPYRFWVLPQVAGNDGLIKTSTWGYVVPNAGFGRVTNPKIRLTFEGAGQQHKLECAIPNTDNLVAQGIQAGKEYRYIVDIAPDTEVTVNGSIEDWEVVGNDYPIFWAQ